MQSSSNEQLNEIKTQLIAREGVYRLVPNAEYCRPKTNYGPNSTLVGSGSVIGGGIGGNGGGLGTGSSNCGSNNSSAASNNSSQSNSTPVRISFTKVSTFGLSVGVDSAFVQSQSTQHHNNSRQLSQSLNGGLDSVINFNNVVIPTNSTNSNNKDQQSNQANNNLHHHPYHHNNSLTGAENISESNIERICFNIGREIFIFEFNGLEPADLSKLADRRSYKATSPTCHEFCSNPELRLSLLLVGFSAGQIQLIDLYRGDVNKFYNQERLIEKSRVTCIRWLPKSKSNFLVSYASGQMYLYKEDLTSGTTPPNYQQFKSGDGFTIYSCKSKVARNPIYRWSIGTGAIHEHSFSPCGEFLATVSQDGFLRVFNYDRMELVGRMRSYFGGLLCVGWSPDSKFIVTGGEDDLITIWSMTDKRVIARGQGHKSWVNVVTFDPYMTTFGASNALNEDSGLGLGLGLGGGGDDSRSSESDEIVDELLLTTLNSNKSRTTKSLSNSNQCNHHHNHQQQQNYITSYRIGSVGQDTQICLWDLTDDIIRQSSSIVVKSRTSILNSSAMTASTTITGTDGNSNNSSTPEVVVANGMVPTLVTSNAITSTSGSSSTTTQISSSNRHSSSHHHHPFSFNSLIKVGSKSSSSSSSDPHHPKQHRSAFSLSSRSFSDKHAKSQAAAAAALAAATASNNSSHPTSSSLGPASGSVATGLIESNIAANATISNSSSSAIMNGLSSTLMLQSSNNSSTSSSSCDPARLLGTPLCPRLGEVPMLEPHVCKKVAHERLTALHFRKDYLVIANQDGKISIFARPNRTNLKISSPNASLASDVNEIACDDNSSAIV